LNLEFATGTSSEHHLYLFFSYLCMPIHSASNTVDINSSTHVSALISLDQTCRERSSTHNRMQELHLVLVAGWRNHSKSTRWWSMIDRGQMPRFSSPRIPAPSLHRENAVLRVTAVKQTRWHGMPGRRESTWRGWYRYCSSSAVEGSDIVGGRDQVQGLASSWTKPVSLLRHSSVGHSSVHHPDSILARRSFSLSLFLHVF